MDLEDSLELSEGAGEQEPAIAEKEDSTEFSDESPLIAHYPTVTASPIVTPSPAAPMAPKVEAPAHQDPAPVVLSLLLLLNMNPPLPLLLLKPLQPLPLNSWWELVPL